MVRKVKQAAGRGLGVGAGGGCFNEGCSGKRGTGWLICVERFPVRGVEATSMSPKIVESKLSKSSAH